MLDYFTLKVKTKSRLGLCKIVNSSSHLDLLNFFFLSLFPCFLSFIFELFHLLILNWFGLEPIVRA